MRSGFRLQSCVVIFVKYTMFVAQQKMFIRKSKICVL